MISGVCQRMPQKCLCVDHLQMYSLLLENHHQYVVLTDSIGVISIACSPNTERAHTHTDDRVPSPHSHTHVVYPHLPPLADQLSVVTVHTSCGVDCRMHGLTQRFSLERYGIHQIWLRMDRWVSEWKIKGLIDRFRVGNSIYGRQ